MKAIILAGGLGTRLRPLTYTLPKPLVLVGGKPLIHLTATKLAQAGFDQIIVTTNFMADMIASYFRKVDFSVPVVCVEEKTAMGTAGCVKNLENMLTETFVVLPGDTIADIDLKALIDFHKGRKSIVTLALMSVDDTAEYGIVQLNNRGRILRFQEKPKTEESFSNLANTGYYVLEPAALKFIPSGEAFDFSFGLFPKLLREDALIYGYVTDRYWIDIGRVEKYIDGNKWFVTNLPSSEIAPTSHVEEILPPEAHVVVGQWSIIKRGAQIKDATVLGEKVTVESGAIISNSIIYPNVIIGSSCKISDSVIGEETQLQEEVTVEKNVIIGKGCRISRKAHIKSGSKIGPYFDVSPLTSIEGVASTFANKGSTTQLYLERNPQLQHLNKEEVRIFGLLAEFGELPAKTISNLSNIPYSQIHRLLFKLQDEGFIVSYGEAPKLFALRYEYPERLELKLG